jgi:hypothetical protein
MKARMKRTSKRSWSSMTSKRWTLQQQRKRKVKSNNPSTLDTRMPTSKAINKREARKMEMNGQQRRRKCIRRRRSLRWEKERTMGVVMMKKKSRSRRMRKKELRSSQSIPRCSRN